MYRNSKADKLRGRSSLLNCVKISDTSVI